MTRLVRFVFWLVLLAPVVTVAGDWNEWRGPQRNGVVENGPPLVTNWPAEGPKRLWASEEEIPGDDTFGGYRGGGYSSVAVADGRAYCLFIVPREVKLATRTLTVQKLSGLGWAAKKPPADLLATAEVVRVSEERQALTNAAAVQAWAQKWVDQLPQDQKRSFGAYLITRLKQGKEARDLALLDKLATITNTPFASQKALDSWFTENGIEGDFRKAVQSQIPEAETHRDTGVICLDAATGKTVWKKLFTGGLCLPIYENVPSSGTPCVVNGKVYVLGTSGMAFCLDAKTGDTVWNTMADDGRQRDNHCSFAVADGVAVAPVVPLTGFDAEIGKVLWTHDTKATWSSPVMWRKDGRTYFVVRTGGKLLCLDPKPGTILWSLDDSTPDIIYAGSTPVVEGDRLVLGGKCSVRLYKLSLEKAEQVWNVDCPTDYCSSPTVYQGHVYVFARAGASCIDLENGKVLWQDKEIKTGCYCSPIFADGKCFMQGAHNGAMVDGLLCMIGVSPEKGQVLADSKFRQALCTTPAVVDGRMFCRTAKSIVCFDLRK